MISADCDAIRDDLDAFADGELRGDELRHLAQHLGGCARCADEVEIRRNLGGMIREAATGAVDVAALRGLAPRVVARVRAESALSWRAWFDRASDDWQWVIVGSGAVTATFVSMLFCGALLLFGTVVPHGDSLSALGSNLRASPGEMYAEVSRQGAPSDEVILVRLETGATTAGNLQPLFAREDDERWWVRALGETLASGGPLVQLGSMPEEARRHTEWLLDNITRVRGAEPGVGPLGTLNLHRLHLFTNTEVTAKGLQP